MKNLILAQRLLYIAVLIAVVVTIAQPFVMPIKLAQAPLTPLIVASIYSLLFAAILGLGAYKLLSKEGWPRFLIVLMFIADAMPTVKNWIVIWETTKIFAIIYFIKIILILIAVGLTATKSARFYYKSRE